MTRLLTLGQVRLAPDGDASGGSPQVQPKRIALLAYLALMTGRGTLRRDLLLALFWPELGEEEARRALRQALHYLRRLVGENVLLSNGDELSVRDGALDCDAVRFERLAEAGRAVEALSLYRGDFLDGFHVPDVAPEYEEWVDRTRGRLRRRAAALAWTAAETDEREGNGARAVDWARRACELEPDQEAGWRRLMLLQERVGDRAGALSSYGELVQRLKREFDADPAAETMEVASAIRSARGTATSPPATRAPESPERALPAPEPARPPSRPRRALPGLALLLVAGAGFAAFQAAAERRDQPSLLSTGELAARDRLLVADFTDRTGDPLLAAAVTEAFRLDLAQSPLVRVLTPRQVRSTLGRMERDADLAVNDSLAREVALREGVKAFVTGSVGRVGGSYTVGVQLVSAQRGEALVAVRETARDSTELIAAVDRASKALRHRIGESLRELRAMPALLQVTTGSLEALRHFTEGQRLFRAGQRTLGLERVKRAVELDTGFATAHLELAMGYTALAEHGRAFAAHRHALANQRRLPFLERGFLVGSTAHGRGDYETAIDAYTRVLERYPDDYAALNNLALVYRDRREYAAAESLFLEAAGIDSTIPNFYFGIHSAEVLQGRFTDSRRTLDEIGRRFPGNPVLMTVEIQDAAARQDWEAAARHAEVRIAAAQGDTLQLVDPFEALAGIAMTQGRLSEAERLWRTHLALSEASGSHGRHLFGVQQLGYLLLRYRNDSRAAAALVDSALATRPLDSLLPGDRPYGELARFYASAGDLSRALALAAAAVSNDRMLGRNLLAERSWTRGTIALAQGRAEVAETELRQAAETHVCAMCPLPALARAYEAVGKPEAAIVVYERYLSTPWLWRYEVDALELGWVLRRLGELYEERGETVKAAGAYTRLLRLWRRSDAELQPAVEQVRRRLEAVTEGPLQD